MSRHCFRLGLRVEVPGWRGFSHEGEIGIEIAVRRWRRFNMRIDDKARAETGNTVTGGRWRFHAFFFFQFQSFNNRLEDGLSEEHAAFPSPV